MTDLYFEDVTVGARYETAAYTISADEALAFGRRYVPMPYHVDEAAARAAGYDGIIVPGHLSAAIAFGLFVRLGLFARTGTAAPGARMRWFRPIYPGDTLRAVAEVVAISPAPQPGGRDAVEMKLSAYDQEDRLALTYEWLQFLARRAG
ncbi:MAG: hypothetical protein FJX67_17645 [Alphaproteobacteria bacterium]|nr:hypothetical protein [Alphaproteobacteria bacterium]